MTFLNVFSGTTVYPAEVNYRAVALSANVTLEWPTEVSSTSNILASIMDVTPSTSGLVVRLPAANLASVGETALFFNVGSDAFTIADNGGNTVVSIAPGIAWQVYLTSNATANGTWRATQYGAGTSTATAGSLVGAGIKAIGATLNQAMASSSINTNYTIGIADRSAVLNWTGGAGVFTLPDAGTVGSDWFVNVRNSGTGAISLTPGTGGQLVNGAATLIMNPTDSAVVFSDGAGFFTIGLGQSSVFAFDFVSIDLTGLGATYTLTGANLNRVAYRFTGNITGNVQVIVPPTVQQYWVSNETDLASAPYTIELKTAAGLGVTVSRLQRVIMYCDGTDVIDADTGVISLPLSVSQGGTGSTTASGARINLGGTSTGIAVFTAATPAIAVAGLGATAVGTALFTAVDAAAGRTTLGATATGSALFTAVDAAAGRTALGATTVGSDIFIAADAAAVRTLLGATTVGNAVFTAVDAAAARTAIGATATGSALFTAVDAPAARTTLGATTVGDAVFTAVDAAAGRTALGAAPLASPTFTGTVTTGTTDLLGSARGNVTVVSASTVDCSLGNYFTKTASGALTWTFSNAPASRAYSFVLELTNGGTGTQTWPASVDWPSGVAPTLTTSGVDVLGFITDDGGTIWRGVLLMKDSK
jgi:hypothetical protein